MKTPISAFLFHNVPKRNKNVLLLSTLNDDGKIDDDTGDAFKPEVITDYNLMKGGVYVVDKMKSEYSTAIDGHIPVSFSSRGFQNETSEEETFSLEILDEEFSVFR
ncbi:unnamed protein product [Acanthoscelides obtectus]|uniref:Uncharacterized protein n=1 Tax=Acanthoscelides obtectus TaxID=200917 RepID=A0A9P0PTN4_ACAOB|nr:unnamed protein product [Acanthoscelides obtectus]CAK1640451.1 hypothetical protein AOBTE_LOCUS11729 [Acanthoscelides obtectus]